MAFIKTIKPNENRSEGNHLCMKVSEGDLEHEQENIQMLKLNVNVAYSMIESGEIMDGKAIMQLQYAILNSLCS